MSNTLAIAATTSTLRNLLLTRIPALDADLSDLEVTIQPPDLARKGITKAQLNLFLYQTVVNGAWRNLDMPRQVRPGETGAPPLALNLHYLVTAYGRGETDTDGTTHRVLGGALSVLHDHPLLGQGEIAASLPNNDLASQFERLRITPLVIGIEEMSRLWTVFQTQYRVSAAYEVTVVLIDARSPAKAALPVLTRGPGDRGVATVTGAAPVLTELRPPMSQPAAHQGEDVGILGSQLQSADAVVRFTSTRLAQPIELMPQPGGSASEITVHLPDKTEDPSVMSRWAPGFYTASLVVTHAGLPPLLSNPVAFALAPRISVTPSAAPAGTLNLTLNCEPRIVSGQRVLLIFGEQQVEPASLTNPADATQPSMLTFTIPGVAAGIYVVRLRVDGADSIPVVYSGTPPVPAFDPAQRVTVT
ncbi:MAG: DUF4255 domain-containing protein [Hydrogenophilales bacterium]|nr:DUF4255 domain-containing protein [Hydrogenophilales bacterium]